MPLTAKEFMAAVERDREALARGEAPAGTKTCDCCGVPIQPAVTGAHWVGTPVLPPPMPPRKDPVPEPEGDIWDELEKYPVGGRGIRRRT